MPCGTRAVVQCTGQTLWSHQYGHNHCPFDDKVDALARQAAATHPLQSRPCVLRRPGENLASPGSRNVRPKIIAEGAAERQSISAPQHERTRRRRREPLAHPESRNVRPKGSMTSLQVQSPTSVPKNAQSMHPSDGRERGKYIRQVGHWSLAKSTAKYVVKQIKTMVTIPMWNPKLLSFSVYHRRPVGGLNCVQSRSFSLQHFLDVFFFQEACMAHM